MVAKDVSLDVKTSVGAIVNTVRAWSQTQSAIVEILRTNETMLRDLGAWSKIETILANTAENYFDALLPMVFDTKEVDVAPLKKKILEVTTPFVKLHGSVFEIARRAS